MIRTTRRNLLAAVTLTTPALAQDVWPSRPVRCIVPLPPGGGTDATARIAMRRLSEALGVPVVIENRPGGGGMVGTEALARAAADGYTIGVATSSSHPVAPIFRRDLPYDPITSFTPITLIGNTPYVLIGGPAAQATDFPSLIARIKANPGQVVYASVGITTLGYLLTRQLELLTGIEMRHVPYRGSSQVYPDLLNGTVALLLDNPPASAAMVRNGNFTAYAVTRASAMLPQVPIFSSFGIAGFDAAFWYGLMGPAGMPPAIVTRIQQVLAQAFLSGNGKAELEAMDVIPAMPAPMEFTQIVADDARKWRALADRLNIQPE